MRNVKRTLLERKVVRPLVHVDSVLAGDDVLEGGPLTGSLLFSVSISRSRSLYLHRVPATGPLQIRHSVPSQTQLSLLHHRHIRPSTVVERRFVLAVPTTCPRITHGQCSLPAM